MYESPNCCVSPKESKGPTYEPSTSPCDGSGHRTTVLSDKAFAAMVGANSPVTTAASTTYQTHLVVNLRFICRSLSD